MKPTRKERANMTKEEMLRALWLMDDYIDSFGWHTVSEDGLPKPNRYGYWCKLDNGQYMQLYFDDGFFYYLGKTPVYIYAGVIAWQELTEISVG